jgi:uncharacterized membrane protein
MPTSRALYGRMAIALLALLGFFDAVYLTLERFGPQIALVCPVGGGCEAVQASRWSTLPPGDGIPVASLGVVGYGALLLLALVGIGRNRLGPLPIAPTLLGVASGGGLLSLYFTALQLFVIGAVCSWCIGSALIEAAIWVAALSGRRAGQVEPTGDLDPRHRAHRVRREDVTGATRCCRRDDRDR